jgi:hypothetical protein
VAGDVSELCLAGDPSTVSGNGSVMSSFGALRPYRVPIRIRRRDPEQAEQTPMTRMQHSTLLWLRHPPEHMSPTQEAAKLRTCYSVPTGKPPTCFSAEATRTAWKGTRTMVATRPSSCRSEKETSGFKGSMDVGNKAEQHLPAQTRRGK